MNDTVQFNFGRMTDMSIFSTDDDPKTEKLLDAAKAAFLTHGYAAASMDQVARLAQASKTTLYTRFPSKESLFIAVVRRECARRGMGFAAQDFDHLPLEAALRDIADRFLDLLWSPEALRMHQVVTGEATRQPEIARLFYDAAVAPACAAVTGYINRAMARRLLPENDAEFIALQFLASLQGGPHCALTLGLGEPPPPDQRRAYVARAVALFLRGALAS
ncbi:MAG TPA: TetR/AcrR family transcriptional regulator [Azospirillaceae bacterium]|nr:TetR/AcrR family transcriptional regulator [Azospirillaceae bacterium]